MGVNKWRYRESKMSMELLGLEGIMDPILIVVNIILFILNNEMNYFYFGLCYSIANLL